MTYFVSLLLFINILLKNRIQGWNYKNFNNFAKMYIPTYLKTNFGHKHSRINCHKSKIQPQKFIDAKKDFIYKLLMFVYY